MQEPDCAISTEEVVFKHCATAYLPSRYASVGILERRNTTIGIDCEESLSFHIFNITQLVRKLKLFEDDGDLSGVWALHVLIRDW